MILKNCRLIPELSGGVKTDCGAVKIENGKITEVHADVDVKYEGESEIIDCNGKSLLPGLIDAHTHIIGIRNYSPELLKNPMKLFMQSCIGTQKYLDYGFTTIRDCGTPLRVANFVRDAYSSGLCIGPRILSGGLIISPTEIEEADIIYDMYTWADGAEEIRKAVRKEIAEHTDFIKIMASGSAFHKQGIPVQPIITREELITAVETATMKGTYVAAHAHGDIAIRLCVENGVRTVEHASFISDETIDVLKGTKDCYLIPTLSAMYQNEQETIGTPFEYLLEKLKKMLVLSSERLGSAYRAGLKLGFGTDSTYGMDQFDDGIEFRFRSENCGMKNIDILLQATKYNAEIMQIADITGEIKTGLAGDLILVDGKPDENISIMYGKPDAVFMGGIKVK